MERPVSYHSQGARISAVLYGPDEAGPSASGGGGRLPAGQAGLPGIVLCNGFTCIKELILPDYARRFAAAGYVALAFDYRGFGESEGERGRLIPYEQVMDIRNSITFMETLDEVDPERIGLWGTSYGAANVIYAAGIDPRPRCIVAQVGFGDGGRGLSRRPPEEVAAVMEMIRNERQQRVLTGKSTMVDPFLILNDPDSVAFFGQAMKELPQLRTEVPLETAEATLEYRPEEVVGRIAPRALLLIAAEFDVPTPADEFRSVYAKAGEPKKLVVIEGIRHYDIYQGKPFERSVQEALEWYGRYL
jgi:alpha-beta hydrolase superfamily lysophospholipase